MKEYKIYMVSDWRNVTRANMQGLRGDDAGGWAVDGGVVCLNGWVSRGRDNSLGHSHNPHTISPGPHRRRGRLGPARRPGVLRGRDGRLLHVHPRHRPQGI